jgi:hypothetical protein
MKSENLITTWFIGGKLGKKKERFAIRCLKNSISLGNGFEPSDEDLMDLNSHKEKTDQRTTTSPE